MGVKDQYSSEEWTMLREAPYLVGAGVVASDPGGLVGALQEAFAMSTSLLDAAKAHSDVPLIKELSEDRQKPPSPRALMPEQGSAQERLAAFRLSALSRCQTAVALVEQKAGPQVAAAYRGWLVGVAETVANAAKEGSILGIGGERVSADERAFLDSLRTTLSGKVPVPPAAT